MPRFAGLRLAAPRDFAALAERFAAARLGAALARVALGFAAELARDLVAFDFARNAVLRALLLRAPPDGRDAVDAFDAEAPASIDHLPDITRCAASATASAISEPSLVALAATLLAACCAVSAASSPASRILRRAAGLALIAAAAAARPAASISLLIAAFANLSTVVLPDDDDRLDDDLEADPELDFLEDFFGDFAIAFSPSVAWERHFSAVTVPE